jgi:hypothetical protein
MIAALSLTGSARGSRARFGDPPNRPGIGNRKSSMPRPVRSEGNRTNAASRRVEHAGGVCSPDRRFGLRLARCVIYVVLGLILDDRERRCVLAGTVEFAVLDKSTGELTPARVHLKDSAGKPVRADVFPFFRDHFVCPGNVRLNLPADRYSFEVERGPEYRLQSGSFIADQTTNKTVLVELERIADMAAEGWWCGDLHVHRPVKDIELLMQAEDLHIAPVITWWNDQNQWTNQPRQANPLVRFDKNRFYQVLGGEDEREGGALLYFNLKEPLSIGGSSREYPSPMKFLAEARRHESAWVDIEKPFWWDAPTWLASGQCDSIGLANNHMCRDQMYESEAWGKSRDPQRLPPPRGNGFWTQEIYYHILNCGLRIPPSAGSASGVLPNPVGYNRVYVHCGNRLTWEKWWEGLRAGRSFVSNGPLLRCAANGNLPGHVFKAPEGKTLRLKIDAKLTSRDPITAVEIIRNGQVERTVPFDEWEKTASLGELKFNESGWFLVRAIADNPKTFRFASTAPFYVEIGGDKRRISKASAQFFLDWVRERVQRVKLADPVEREEVLSHHRAAEIIWREKVAQANAE